MNKPLARAVYKEEDLKGVYDALAEKYGDRMAGKMMSNVLADEVYLNDEYQVAVRRFTIMGTPMVHLSIKRVDKEPARDWRDLQEIKNQLVGPECEGVELFPKESRLVDTVNQTHLWCMAEKGRQFPWGFDAGRVTEGDARLPDLPNATQRPRDKRYKYCEHGALKGKCIIKGCPNNPGTPRYITKDD